MKLLSLILTCLWALYFANTGQVLADTHHKPEFELTQRATVKFSSTLTELTELERDGEFVEAIELINDALHGPHINGPMWRRLKSRKSDIQNQLEISLRIMSANSLSDDGKHDEASKIILSLAAQDLGDFNTKMLSEVLDSVYREEPTVHDRTKRTLTEFWFYTLLSVILIALLFATKVFFNFMARRLPIRWRLSGIDDSTSRSVQHVLASSFDEWKLAKNPSTLSGLLMLEATDIPPAPRLDTSQGGNLFSDELAASEFQVAGFSVGAIAKLIDALFAWFWPRTREIRGVAYIGSDDNLCIRLTASLREQKKNARKKDATELSSSRSAQQKKRRTITVSAIADGKDENAVQLASDEVAYKMLYALSSGSSQKVTDANEFRKGLKLLNDYLSVTPRRDGSHHWYDLYGAKEIFESIRKTRPDNLEAHLYEGIALDLMERHEDAAAHFDHVKLLTNKSADTTDKKLNSQAAYNGAVAHLRNLYGLKQIDEAIRRLDEIVTLEPRLEDSALTAMAMATKADAYANRTIHWRDINRSELKLGSDSSDEELLNKVIQDHSQKVRELLKPLQIIVAELNDPEKKGDVAANWDVSEVRQVEWAIHNALADLYLYAATAMLKVDASQYPGYSEYSAARGKPEFKKNVEQALHNLRQCEMLLPAGVETLSNIGTLYLIRGQSGDLATARRYLERAILLNPFYEYAHYRLALTWQAEGWREMVVKTLKDCPVPPQIPQLDQLFRDYYIRPKAKYDLVEEMIWSSEDQAIAKTTSSVPSDENSSVSPTMGDKGTSKE